MPTSTIMGELSCYGTEVLKDKSLQDLPYKIELNEWGKIEMSPANNFHSFYQAKVMRLLIKKMPKGAKSKKNFNHKNIETLPIMVYFFEKSDFREDGKIADTAQMLNLTSERKENRASI